MKKYLLKYREYYHEPNHPELSKRGIGWTDKVMIIEQYPCNLSDAYLDNILNFMTPKDRERNYYYDLIPLS